MKDKLKILIFSLALLCGFSYQTYKHFDQPILNCEELQETNKGACIVEE